MTCPRSLAIAAALLALPAASARAETDARDYEGGVYLPSGTTVAAAYFRHQSTSDTQSISQDLALFRAIHLLKFDNLIVVPFDMYVPVVDVTVLEPIGAIHASGLGDLTYLPTVSYVIPQDATTHTYFGLTTYITAPTGQYKNDRFVNIGSNRWSVQPQLAIGQRFMKAITVEAVGNVLFATSNSQALVPGVPVALGLQTLKQDPIWGAELHAAVDLSTTFYTAVEYYLKQTGRAHFDLNLPTGALDTTYAASQRLHSLRLTFGVRLEKSSLLLLQLNEDVGGTGGASLGQFFGARLSHVFF
jgi:hypothetical protein